MTTTNAPPLLLVDAMLGKVARDLRLLGYDTLFAGGLPDTAILRRCQAEQRLLVTCDRQLQQRARHLALPLVRRGATPPPSVQVLRFLAAYPLPPSAFSRCLACNGELLPRPRTEVRSRVPDHVWAQQQTFHVCPTCARVYWPGSHTARLHTRCRLLRQALQTPTHQV